MKKIFKVVYIVVAILLAVSCSAIKEVDTDSAETETEKSETPQILTLVLEINANNSIQIQETLLAPGQLKRDKYTQVYKKNDDLIISFYDNNGDVCKTVSIANPLIKKVEYSENYRDMQAKIVQLEKAPFSIRLQHEECFKIIIIEKIIDEKEQKRIRLLEMPLNLDSYE